MTRDTKGNIGWSVLALLLGIVVIILMIAREVYQSVKGGFPIEWNDVIRYGILIGVFGGFHYFISDYFFNVPWWAML